MFDAFTIPQLVAVIRNAVRDHSLPASWLPTGTYSREEALLEINELCTEFALTPNADGKLVQIEEDAA